MYTPSSIHNLATFAWGATAWPCGDQYCVFWGDHYSVLFHPYARGCHCYVARATRYARARISSFYESEEDVNVFDQTYSMKLMHDDNTSLFRAALPIIGSSASGGPNRIGQKPGPLRVQTFAFFHQNHSVTSVFISFITYSDLHRAKENKRVHCKK